MTGLIGLIAIVVGVVWFCNWWMANMRFDVPHIRRKTD